MKTVSCKQLLSPGLPRVLKQLKLGMMHTFFWGFFFMDPLKVWEVESIAVPQSLGPLQILSGLKVKALVRPLRNISWKVNLPSNRRAWAGFPQYLPYILGTFTIHFKGGGERKQQRDREMTWARFKLLFLHKHHRNIRVQHMQFAPSLWHKLFIW